MRDRVLILVITSLLFVSMEGFANPVDEASFHQTHHSHAEDGNSQWYPDSDGSDHQSDACEHFCHAHVVALTAEVATAGLTKFQSFVPVPVAYNATHSPAPPTPPPNY